MRGGRNARGGACATPSILVSNSMIVEGSRVEVGGRVGELTGFVFEAQRGREMRLGRGVGLRGRARHDA